jgi:hypothetical protein
MAKRFTFYYKAHEEVIADNYEEAIKKFGENLKKDYKIISVKEEYK